MRKFVVAAIAALLSFAASVTYALGFGQIQLQSALNQPLKAEIPLLAVKPAERDQVSVAIADPDTFQRFGIERPGVLDRMDVEVAPGSDATNLRVLITSRVPIREPFLTFLMEANWPDGRAIREYTVLLDPPVSTPTVSAPPAAAPAPEPIAQEPAAPDPIAQEPVAPPPPAATATPTQRSTPQPSAPLPEPAKQQVAAPEPATQPQPQKPAPSPASRPAQQAVIASPPPAPEPAPVIQQPQPSPAVQSTPPDDPEYYNDDIGTIEPGPPERSYGPVAPKETLWRIARSTLPASGVTMNQMMLAIYQANPQAFDGNINQILKGSMLTIPSKRDIVQINVLAAKAEIDDQLSAPPPKPKPQPKPKSQPKLAGEQAPPEAETATEKQTASQTEPEVSSAKLRLEPASEADTAKASETPKSSENDTQRTAETSTDKPKTGESDTQSAQDAEQPRAQETASAAQAGASEPQASAEATASDEVGQAPANQASSADPAEAAEKPQSTDLADSSSVTADSETASVNDQTTQPTTPEQDSPSTAEASPVDSETAESAGGAVAGSSEPAPEAGSEPDEDPETVGTLDDTSTQATGNAEDAVPAALDSGTGAGDGQAAAATPEPAAGTPESAGEDASSQPAAITQNTSSDGFPALDQPVAENSWAAWITPQRLLIGLAVVLLLIALLIKLSRGKRGSANTAGRSADVPRMPPVTMGGAAATAAGTASDEQGAATAASAQPSEPNSEIDIDELLADADSHIAFELYDEALAALALGFSEYPGHPALQRKEMEVHHAAGDRETFLERVDEYYPDPDETDADWLVVAAMGRELAPDDDRFQAAAQAHGAETEPPSAAVDSSDSADALEPGPQADSAVDPASEFDSVGDTEELDPDALPAFNSPQSDLADDAGEPTAFGVPTAATEDDEGVADDLDTTLGESAFESSEDDSLASDDIDDWFDSQNRSDGTADVAGDESLESELPAAAEDNELETASLDDDLSLDFDLSDFDAGDSDSAQASDTPQEEIKASNSFDVDDGLDFDLSELDLGDPKDAADSDDTLTTDTAEPIASSELSDDEAEDVSEQQPSAAPVSQPSGSLDIEDIENAGFIEDDPAIDGDGGDTQASEELDDDEVVTKLDLARAYLDMGEPDMAASLLQEVGGQGNAEQQREAKSLLDQIDQA